MSKPHLLRFPSMVSTLPNTNSKGWALIAQMHLRREGYFCYVEVNGDQWFLISNYPESSYMNIPVIKITQDFFP